MRKRQSVVMLFIVLVMILMSVQLVMAAERGTETPDPEIGEVMFEGPDAYTVLAQAKDFARYCRCDVYEGHLRRLRAELVQFELTFYR